MVNAKLELLVDLAIASLKKDAKLDVMHAILRSGFTKGHCVTLDKDESAVISILKDASITNTSAACQEPIASTAFFSQQKSCLSQHSMGNQREINSTHGVQIAIPHKKPRQMLSHPFRSNLQSKCPQIC